MTDVNGFHSDPRDSHGAQSDHYDVHDVIGKGNRDTSRQGGRVRDGEPSHRDFAGEPGVLLDGPDVCTLNVLLVGNDAFAQRVTKRFTQARLVVKTSRVTNYLMALGQASHVRPDVVVGQLEGLSGLRESIITGLRRLSPGVRLVVIAEPEKESFAIKAVEAGFDDYLLEPVEASVLADVLLQETRASTRAEADVGAVQGQGRSGALVFAPAQQPWQSKQTQPGSSQTAAKTALADVAEPWGDLWQADLAGMVLGSRDEDESIDPPQSQQSQRPPRRPESGDASRDATQPSGDPKQNVKPSAATSDRPVGPRASTPQSQAAGPMYGHDPYDTSDAELGDIDLVDCLLTEPARFESLVLKLVAGRSGVSDVGFSLNAAQVPDEHAGAWVTFRGRRLGVLHAPPPAVKTQLAPWASWMAHWLAMQQQMTSLWNMANKDELTGAWNRRFFDRHLARVVAQAAIKRFPVTVLMFDIDNFKTYNDRYGHPAGDEILRETVRLMGSVVREHDVVARIGGDEFAVIFWDPHGPRKPNSSHPDDVRDAARRFQKAICSHHFPKLLEEAPGTLTISGGLASYPWDGVTAQSLVERADTMLLHSKTQGKNAITFGAGAARQSDPFEHGS